MTTQDEPFWLNTRSTNSLPHLHFVHGNSFPAGSYREFLLQLSSHYQIHALERLGHNPDFPVADGWANLRMELIASLEKANVKPVILVGHSLGGMLSFMVAKMRPDLVRCVVMLDSPVVGGWRAKAWRVVKLIGMARFMSPAKFSKKRRKSWPDAESAYQHFAEKDMFALWPEQVLRDYIEFGTEPYPNGVTLRFKREIETAIYCALPHDNERFIEPPYPVPVGFICGKISEECRQAGIYHTQRLVGDNFKWIEGGHLYPMERPQAAAEMTHAMIQQLLGRIDIKPA